jgi:two-component system chemotaxis sensor kinase CheA
MIADIQGAPVLRLRGSLVPVVDLRRTLGLPAGPAGADAGRTMVVLTSNGRPFALEVDDVLDTEEIVVKPLGAQVQQLGVYAGATVRGDGRVALVLDVQGLSRRAGLSVDETRSEGLAASQVATRNSSFLILQGADDGRLAVPLAAVTRLEEVEAARLERTGGGEAIQYRGAILPVVRLSGLLTERRRTARTAPPPATGRVQLVVQEVAGRRVGLLVESVLDVVEEAIEIDHTSVRPGVLGRAVIQERITEVLDTTALLAARLAAPEAAHG